MTKPVVLFGAGASIDAGLHDAYQLTEDVYDVLRERDPSAARLFGFVIAKLVVRNSRAGNSPFDKINVEHAYDALKRVLNREGDIIGEFVASWEPLVDSPKPRLDTFKIKRELERSAKISSDLRGRPKIAFDLRSLQNALEGLLRIAPTPSFESERNLRSCINVLADILDTTDKNKDYLTDFILNAGDDIDCIATLNYDTLLEDAAKSKGRDFDYGLNHWNTKRVIRFQPGAPRLLKLHGSVNWLMRGPDEIVFEQPKDSWRQLSRAMIFGGQYEKLNPNGPFLSLRHEFQRSISKATTLAIVGYSFGDDHLNAILRSWMAVKRRAKLIVLDPKGIMSASRLTGTIASRLGDKLLSDSIEFHEIRGGLSTNVAQLCDALRRPPAPEGRPK